MIPDISNIVTIGEIGVIIDDFFELYNDKEEIRFKNKTNQKYFDEHSHHFQNLPENIVFHPTYNMRGRNSLGFSVYIHNQNRIFCYLKSDYKRIVFNAYISYKQLGKRAKNIHMIIPKKYVLKCEISQIKSLLILLNNYVEPKKIEFEKLDKIKKLKVNAFKYKLKQLLSKEIEYSFEENEKKLILYVKVSRSRVIQYSFYFNKREKDIKRFPEIVKNIEKLRNTINSIPENVLIISKTI